MSFTGNAVRILTLRLGQSQAEPFQGESAALRTEWQKRLGLRISEAGEVVPLYPTRPAAPQHVTASWDSRKSTRP